MHGAALTGPKKFALPPPGASTLARLSIHHGRVVPFLTFGMGCSPPSSTRLAPEYPRRSRGVDPLFLPRYRWSIFDVPVPGWELPISWSTEDHELNGEGGPRKFGRLQLKYSSDPALGCDPVWPYRETLQKYFLCGEQLDF